METIVKVIKGDVFIVPNSLATKSDFFCEEKWEEYGFKVDDKTVFVQVWITSEDEENWCRHGAPEGVEVNNNLRLPENLPIELFEGKSEGDVVKHVLPHGNEIHLTLNQSDYRYRHCGKFEEIFNRLKTSYEKTIEAEEMEKRNKEIKDSMKQFEINHHKEMIEYFKNKIELLKKLSGLHSSYPGIQFATQALKEHEEKLRKLTQS